MILEPSPFGLLTPEDDGSLPETPAFDSVAFAEWIITRRPDQAAPGSDWRTWLLLGGRGAGKTRAGAEWVLAQVRGGARSVALVGPTHHAARAVMVEGASGLLAIAPLCERPRWVSSLRELHWPGGARGHVFSADEPDGLRGPQFDAAWADEFCAWTRPEAALSNLRMALRLGERPRLVLTTTPRPTAALRALLEEDGLVISRASTSANDGLSAAAVTHMTALYGGTRLGRQELGGELLEDAGGTLWPRTLLEACRVSQTPELVRIVVAVDPPVTSGSRADACGIVVAGVDANGVAHVLEDASVQGLSPAGWAMRVADVFARWQADCVVAEVNQGGELVRDVLARAAPLLPVRSVHATRSKRARAEPVALLYEQGRVRHAGAFPELEDELNRLGTDAQSGSPDRADALVWAVWALLTDRAAPRIREM